MKEYKAIGLMSGTSLDGLDIAFCRFSEDRGKWDYSIEQAETIPYDKALKDRLGNAPDLTGFELTMLSNTFGRMIGAHVHSFCEKHTLHPQLVASHGHTVFHRPQQGITLQIGSGAEIAAQTGRMTICDFRSKDVALGGQGAPLVPIGDQLLFGEHTSCLNLGGFANVSFDRENKRISFDICAVNIVMNRLCQQVGKEYDDKGLLAESGDIDTGLLDKLNGLAYYTMPFPKSLGKEWADEFIFPLLDSCSISVPAKLRTYCEHIAQQVAHSCVHFKSGSMLVTGGGAHNSFLVQLIQQNSSLDCVVPGRKTIDFKEALVFAFLGVLRYREECNSLSSVTGASADSIGGAIYL